MKLFLALFTNKFVQECVNSIQIGVMRSKKMDVRIWDSSPDWSCLYTLVSDTKI
jgi:hypothetical protein